MLHLVQREGDCAVNKIKKYKATRNEHTSLLAAILSDISDDSDTNFIYKLSANECRQRNNDEITLAAVSPAADQLIHTFVTKKTHESRD